MKTPTTTEQLPRDDQPGRRDVVQAFGRNPEYRCKTERDVLTATLDRDDKEIAVTRNANLYLDRIAYHHYLPAESCDLCRAASLEELLDRFRRGALPTGPCAHWRADRMAAFGAALSAGEFLPTVPLLEIPRPVEPAIFEVNQPAPGSPLLVTGNSELTQAVLLAVVSRAASPLRILFTDTLGHTVDMAMVFKVWTATRVAEALVRFGIRSAEPARIVLPGLAAELASPLSEQLGRAVETGPVCAAELPLYLGPDWTPASPVSSA